MAHRICQVGSVDILRIEKHPSDRHGQIMGSSNDVAGRVDMRAMRQIFVSKIATRTSQFAQIHSDFTLANTSIVMIRSAWNCD